VCARHHIYYRGAKKELLLLKMMMDKELREIFNKSSWQLRKLFKHEKFVSYDNKIVISSHVPPYPSEAFYRFISNVRKGREGKIAIAHVDLTITHACEYRCWHCCSAYRKGSDMPFKLICSVIEELLELGVGMLGLTGGEPLLRRDLVDIVACIDSRSTSALFTTGYGLTTERAAQLKAAGLFSMIISLDHFKPEVHDKLRGYNGAYKIAVDAINISNRIGFYTVINTVATRSLLTDNQIWKLLEFANDQFGVHEVRILEPAPTGALINRDDELLDDDARNTLHELHKIANRSNRYPRVSVSSYMESSKLIGCTAGYHHITIDANGNVCPCDFVPLSFGNVRTESLTVILSRVRKIFSHPQSTCFMRANYKQIRGAFDNELPLSSDKSIQICKRCKFSQPPSIYTKIMC
jgi:radical SAM protein with 4Fe4S-binding SPASM domain